MMRCPIPVVRIPPDELDQLGLEAAAGDAQAEARAISGVAALAWRIVAANLETLRAREAIFADVFADVLADVVMAVRSYRSGRGARLSTYVGRCAERATWKRRRAHLSRIARAAPGETEEVEGVAVEEIEALDERLDLAAHAALLWRLTEMVVSLPDLEREVLRRRFGLFGTVPETLGGIGASLNVSRERIRQIEGDALYRLGARSKPVSRGR